MRRLAMQHLECAALGIEVGSTHPQEHTTTGELGTGMGAATCARSVRPRPLRRPPPRRLTPL
jgi:hypothetical protein